MAGRAPAGSRGLGGRPRWPGPAPAPGIVVRFVLGVGWVAAGAPAMGGLMQRSSQKQSLFNYGTGGGAKRVSIKHLRGSIAVPQGSQCGK